MAPFSWQSQEKGVSLQQELIYKKDMCTYNITVDDKLMEKVRPVFTDNEAIGNWMQSQINLLLTRMAFGLEKESTKKEPLSKRLRGIAQAPLGFDYKK